MTVDLRIGIPIPTSADMGYNRRSWPMYASAVEQAGGTPVEIPLNGTVSQLAALARSCHGFILPGSPADVAPASYGQAPSPECAAPDPHREQTDRMLLEECYASGKPVLGICFGVQSMNVWRGGTLLQDLAPTPVNHAAGAAVAVAHTVVVASNTLLASVLSADASHSEKGELRLPVNSSHHQALDRIGSGLRVSAISHADGVVEAVEGSGEEGSPAFVLGVQWHPERSMAISATSRSIFRALLAAVAAWDQARAVLAVR